MSSAYWDAKYSATPLLWSAGPNRRVEAELADLPPGRALDVACGEGRNALWLASLGWTVTGVDHSDVALGRARGLAAERELDVTFLEADLVTWEPEPAVYDLVLVLFLQLPAADRRVVLHRAAAALAPGGTLFVLGHDLTNLTDGHGGPQDPAVLFTPDDVVAEVAGLTIERAERVLRDVDGADRPAIDALVRARRPAT